MYQPRLDLAGEVCFCPSFWQTKTRINYLIDEYLNLDELRDRLVELPQQFQNPKPRPWATFNWQDINPEQVVGLELDIFLSIIKGALDTEAPIRAYTQTSRQYLEPIHPTMAKFVGGKVDPDGKIIDLGIWEKEERQHTPALAKIYYQLTNTKITPQAKKAKPYQLKKNPYEDLYTHGIHRIATEYGAVCLYIWLMSHTTGTIQAILAELLQDEVNHLSKFWGMGMWLYPDTKELLVKYLLNQIYTVLPQSVEVEKSSGRIKPTFKRMMSVLNWESWSILSRSELIYTFVWILKRMCHWSNQLTPEFLQSCCATPEFFGHDSFDAKYLEIEIL